MNCITCQRELSGKQTKFCSRKCRNQSGNKKNQDYECQQLRGLTRKEFFVRQLGGKCKLCGYCNNLSALTFHHRDPEKKILKLDIRSMSNNALEILQDEVNKCDLLCHNCHHELHHPNLKFGGPTRI